MGAVTTCIDFGAQKNKKQTLVIPVVRIFLEKNFVLRREFVYGVSDYLIIQKTKIMASGPITSWQIDGETVETVSDFIFLGSQITADGDCSHEIKRCLLKSRDITLPTKVRLVKAMVFPVVMYGCESWTVKKAECRKTDAFELWCWRRLLRVLGLQGDPISPF